MEYYGNNDFRDYALAHFGVLGMKWGVRRYQPYSVRPRGSGKGGKEVGDASKTNTKNRLTDKQKKIIKTGVIAAGAVLAIYGAYKFGQFKHFDKIARNVVYKEAARDSRSTAKVLSKSVIDGTYDQAKYKKVFAEELGKRTSGKQFRDSVGKLRNNYIKEDNKYKKKLVKYNVDKLTNPYSQMFGDMKPINYAPSIKKGEQTVKNLNLKDMTMKDLEDLDLW